jgi:hypothetical protein
MWNPITSHVKHQTLNKKIRTKAKTDTDCRTKNVIYCLSCPGCELKYVGETGQEIRKRLNGHRSNIIGKGKDRTILIKHLREAHGQPILPKVCILETLEPDTKPVDRKIRESEWIRLLGTAHPWGLNEQIRNFGTINNETDPLERRTNPWLPVIFPKFFSKIKYTKT